MAYVSVTILTVTLTFVLVKLRFKLDFAAYIIFVTQVVQLIFRLKVFQTDLGVQFSRLHRIMFCILVASPHLGFCFQLNAVLCVRNETNP